MPKIVFPAYFRHFRPEKFFSENRAPSHFGHCHFASLCQISEKTNEPISRKAGNRRTNGRTDGRTDGQRIIYRTSEVGPKIEAKSKSTKTLFTKTAEFNEKRLGAQAITIIGDQNGDITVCGSKDFEELVINGKPLFQGHSGVFRYDTNSFLSTKKPAKNIAPLT